MNQKTASAPAAENKMGTMPIGRLLFNMSLPMMVSMLVQALYNIVDSIFVAKLSENALTAVGDIFRTPKYLSDEKKDSDWKSDYFIKKDTHTVHYGLILDDEENILDEVIVILMKGPNSYTREDVVEIDTHGGNYVVKKILNQLLHHGVRLAEPGEFTKRAFLNGRIDLSQAEAVMKLISSQNDFSYQSALNQLEGSVSKYIEVIRQDILHNLGNMFRIIQC